MDIQEILQQEAKRVVETLKEKAIVVPEWEVLVKEYDSNNHDVMNKTDYPDSITDEGYSDKVSRIALSLQKLATKRIVELVCGIPVKRVYNYNADDEKEKKVADVLEKIFLRNRIESVNIERLSSLFCACETATLWFAMKEQNSLYGVDSSVKLRCRTYSPMDGYMIYPYFDSETDDLTALSFSVTKKEEDKVVEYFDVYTADRHVRYKKIEDWAVEKIENITINKIPAVYCYRPTPVWENTSTLVTEMEWALSRNGNFLRKNSRPMLAVFADEEIAVDKSPDGDVDKSGKVAARDVVQFPKGSDSKYVVWEQAIENLKFYIGELRQSFFTQLQLPDWSYESMKSTPMSGEARKQMFIDAQLKVKDESGRILEMLDREINVVKAFAKVIMGSAYEQAIDNIQVENIITPFSISDEKEQISNLTTAVTGEIMSRREAIQILGYSKDVDKTLKEIAEESNFSGLELTT